VGNKLGFEKGCFVQTLREKTLKSDCKRDNDYRHFSRKIVFKVYGMKLRMRVLQSLERVDLFRVSE
jgi:hypothetical protein